MKKGINFKQVREDKFLLIHPDTLFEYLNMLPKNEAGWIGFKIDEFEEITERKMFADIKPLDARNKS